MTPLSRPSECKPFLGREGTTVSRQVSCFKAIRPMRRLTRQAPTPRADGSAASWPWLQSRGLPADNRQMPRSDLLGAALRSTALSSPALGGLAGLYWAVHHQPGRGASCHAARDVDCARASLGAVVTPYVLGVGAAVIVGILVAFVLLRVARAMRRRPARVARLGWIGSTHCDRRCLRLAGFAPGTKDAARTATDRSSRTTSSGIPPIGRFA